VAGRRQGGAGPLSLSGRYSTSRGTAGELRNENTIESESRLENLEELINAAREYERVEPEPTLDGFCRSRRSTPSRTRSRREGASP
jgi:DNA helicase-2/ATP-dependent DNA helicase PcrA